jgi:hypothetical protein
LTKATKIMSKEQYDKAAKNWWPSNRYFIWNYRRTCW